MLILVPMFWMLFWFGPIGSIDDGVDTVQFRSPSSSVPMTGKPIKIPVLPIRAVADPVEAGHDTPETTFTVVDKLKDPDWFAPDGNAPLLKFPVSGKVCFPIVLRRPRYASGHVWQTPIGASNFTSVGVAKLAIWSKPGIFIPSGPT